MTISTLIPLIALLIWIFSGLRKGADLFSPSRVFGIIWSLAFFLVGFKFSRLQIEWNSWGWFILLLGVISFLLGNYFSFVMNYSKISICPSVIREIFSKLEINERKLFRIIIVYFIVYSICFFVEYLIVGYLPLFTARPERARVEFGVFGVHLIVNGINVILFLIAEYFIFIRGNKSRKALLAVVFIIASASFLTLLQRYNMFMLSMMILCMIYYAKRRIRLRTFVLAAGIVMAFVVTIQSVRLANIAEYYIYSVSQMKYPVRYAVFTEPYMYIVMNLENFVYAAPKIIDHTYGLFTFDFIAALTGVKHTLAEYLNVTKFPHYISGYNTFPFFWAYYYDYGLLGLAFIPFILGLIFSEIFYALHRNPTLVALSMYCVVFSILVVSIISDPLTRLDMMFNFVFIIVIQRYISIDRTAIQPPPKSLNIHSYIT